jgi:hypothetical protein
VNEIQEIIIKVEEHFGGLKLGIDHMIELFSCYGKWHIGIEVAQTVVLILLLVSVVNIPRK